MTEEATILQYGETVYYWHYGKSKKGTITGISAHITEEDGFPVLKVLYIIKEEKEKGINFFLDNVEERFVSTSKARLKKEILNHI